MKPLKWHKFLIYFGLWVNAFGMFASFVTLVSGSQYGELKARLYETFPTMRVIDIAYGLVMAVFAVYLIYTRFQLAGFKKGAPKKLLAFYVASFIAGAAYIAAVVAATDVINTHPDAAEKFIGGMIGRELLSAAIMFIINKVYYGKRKELFVN